VKILRVISTMNPATGGPCQGIRNLVPELIKSGIENEIVCLDEPDASYLKGESFKIYAIGKSEGAWQYNRLLIQWLRENILKYDIVIVHGLWLYHGYAVRKVLKDLKNPVPYFVMAHGMLDPYFQKNEARKLKAIRNIFYWKLVEAKVIKDSNGLLFTCEEELKLARKTFTPYLPKLELNIGYGIPKPISLTEVTSSNENNPYLLFLSRIHPKKGVDMLVDAYIQLLTASNYSEMPDLVIVGPGLEDDFGNELLQRVQENSLAKEKIKFKGMLTGMEKWKVFNSCEAFILPSHQENFGIAVVEALACGKPVLISDKVNIWREIKNSKAGLVESDTVTGTFQLLQTWIGYSKNQKREMSEAALACYLNYFTVARAAKRTYEILSDATGIK